MMASIHHFSKMVLTAPLRLISLKSHLLLWRPQSEYCTGSDFGTGFGLCVVDELVCARGDDQLCLDAIDLRVSLFSFISKLSEPVELDVLAVLDRLRECIFSLAFSLKLGFLASLSERSVLLRERK